MRTWLGVVIAVAACSNKPAEKQQAVGSAVGSAMGSAVGSAMGSAMGSAVGSAAHVRAQPTAQQRADYKGHMKAALALQKQQQWAAAVDEFQAALDAIDGDQRALAELGYSAMNAGDYKHARDADEEAVRVALDPNVKAAALFNLGTVELKLGDIEGARRSFTSSVQLRPNKTVAAALAKLGTAEDKPFCPAGMDPCGCVYDYAAGHPDAGDGCKVTTNPLLPAAWKIYTVSHQAYTESFVLDEHNNFLFVSARSDDHTRHVGDMELAKVEKKTAGRHQLLWIELADNATEMIPRDDDTETELQEHRDLVTICVLGDATTPTRCPLREVPVERSFAGEGSDKTETRAAITLADGTATVTLTSGPSCCELDAMLGAHTLW